MSFVLAISVAFFCYTLVMLILCKINSAKISVEDRLNEVASINARVVNKNDDLNIPFSDRFLKPLISKITEFVSAVLPIKKETKEKLGYQLKMAGLNMSPQEYMTSVFLVTIAIVFFGMVLAFAMGKSGLTMIFYGFVSIYAGFVLARFWLAGKITKRKQEIYHQFPNTLDLLSVSVSAGLGFDQALGYVCEKSDGALIDELDVAQREIALGKSRKEALQDFAKRCDSQEINTFVVAVVQADELGTSMKNVLDIQSSTIRQSHKQNVEEQAQKLSIKILIPMVLFIFPVIFIVLLGPAAPSIMQAIGG